MGSGDWFKAIIRRKKTKQIKGSANERPNGFKQRNQSHKEINKLYNGASSGNAEDFGLTIENIAAIRIQTAFRGFMARKALRRLKGLQRLQTLGEGHYIKNQTSSTLRHIQSWSKIQVQIRARRVCMVTEGRIKQKKQENQLKLEAKLHDIEVEWCGGSETMEEIIARIQHREEAAVKRERALAYAFSHQWRANSGVNLGQFSYEFGKGNYGWSWMERWIAARPWEARLPLQSISPQKAQAKASSKSGKSTKSCTRKEFGSLKPPPTDGKGSTKTTSQPGNEKPVTPFSSKTKLTQGEQLPSQTAKTSC